MLTVKQLADDIGVSKVAVNKKIETLGLKSKLTQEGNRYLIDDDIAEQVRQAFKYRTEQSTTNATKDEKPHGENGTASNKPGVYDDVIQAKDETIKALNDQLAVLKEELKEKNTQIERLHTLMAQQNQLYLTDGQPGSTQEVDAVDAETVSQGEATQEHQEGKKSFWSRLFG